MRKYTPKIDSRYYENFNADIVKVDTKIETIKNKLCDSIGISNFEKFHEILDEKDSITDGDLFKIFSKIDLKIIDEYIHSIVQPILGDKEYLIQKIPNMRIVIPNQDKKGQLLFWHQGIWVGNGYGMRTIWTPLTLSQNSNSLHMADQESSISTTTQFYNENWDYEKLSEKCEEICTPRNMKFGEALLFCQENLHGQRPNITETTRVSFECRILLKNGDFMHKLPGSYFRKPFVYYGIPEKKYENAIIVPQYDGPYFDKDTQFAQTILMNDYIKNIDIDIKSKCIDLVTTHCSYTKFLSKYKHYKNFVFPSLFSFRTTDLIELFQNDSIFHFASEDLVCDSDETKELALYYRNF